MISSGKIHQLWKTHKHVMLYIAIFLAILRMPVDSKCNDSTAISVYIFIYKCICYISISGKWAYFTHTKISLCFCRNGQMLLLMVFYISVDLNLDNFYSSTSAFCKCLWDLYCCFIKMEICRSSPEEHCQITVVLSAVLCVILLAEMLT